MINLLTYIDALPWWGLVLWMGGLVLVAAIIHQLWDRTGGSGWRR